MSMSYTPVQNRFWSDGWIRQLNALDRYLFLYLLTNGRAGLTGIYELPLDLLAAECGIDEKDLRLSMLIRLEPKVYYKEGWVIMVKYLNHRVSNSPDYIRGIRKAFGELPTHIQELARKCGYDIDTLPRPSPHQGTIDKNRREENISATRTVSEEDEEKPKKTPRAKYPHSKEVFSWFPKPERGWEINTTELKYGELLWERGEEAVRKALRYHDKHKDDEGYGYVVVKPSQLEGKWNDIAEYARRNK